MTRKIKSTLSVLGLTALASIAQAQPAGGPGNGQGGQGGPGGQNFQQLFQNWQNMTPEQRTAAMQQMNEARIRRDLERYGITDARVQTNIIAYSNAQDTARNAIREQARKVTEALQNNTPDAQLFALFGELRRLIEAEKTRSETARKTLDGLVGYSKNPRLGIVLTMMGFIGDEANYIGGGRGGFGGGFGGFGGGQGGPRGGQGGGQGGPRGGQGQGGQQNN
jgi:Spy/CpxP family protein refolding chaperone